MFGAITQPLLHQTSKRIDTDKWNIEFRQSSDETGIARRDDRFPTRKSILSQFPSDTILFVLPQRTVNYDPCRRMTASESLEHPFLRKSNEAYKLEKAKVRATDKGKSKCNTDDGIEEDICYEDGPTRDSDSTLEMLGAKKHSSGKRSHHEMPESFNISSGINECFEDIQEIIEAESPSTMKKQLQSEKRGIFTNRTGYDGYEDDFEDYL